MDGSPNLETVCIFYPKNQLPRHNLQDANNKKITLYMYIYTFITSLKYTFNLIFQANNFQLFTQWNSLHTVEFVES